MQHQGKERSACMQLSQVPTRSSEFTCACGLRGRETRREPASIEAAVAEVLAKRNCCPVPIRSSPHRTFASLSLFTVYIYALSTFA
jgi:hypothetical protein